MLDKHYLAPLFTPRSIVVLAGDPEHPDAPELTAQARALHAALQAQAYTGSLTHLDIQGSSGTLHDLARSRADLAVLALPAQELNAGLEIACRIRCRAALILDSGVHALQAAQLQRIARREGVHLLGPNSLGLQRPKLRLNASSAGPLAQAGPMALVCQSGALLSAVLDWADNNAVGFSSVVSLGPHPGIGLSETLDFLAHDSDTHSIAICMEGIQDARRFMSALRSAAHAKPVIVLKAGRQSAGHAAAYTHSGAIVGDDAVFDTALRRAGAVRVHSFVELFSVAKCLATRSRPAGPRLAILTNGGGPGVLATDRAQGLGLTLGTLPEAARARLAAQLPAQATLQGLLDLSESATPEHYRAALEAAMDSRDVDGVLALFSPKTGSDATAIAQALVQAQRPGGKPLLTCLLGDRSIQEARQLLRQAQLPTFRTPESAVGAYASMTAYHRNQQLLLQTPTHLSTEHAQPDIDGARLVIEGVLAERRQLLTEMESKALLAAFHIPVTRTLLARSGQEAMLIATQLGFPVALKIDSPDIAHKSDVEGVQLNLGNATEVRHAYEAMMQRVRRLAPQAQLNGITVQPMARSQRGREVCIGLVRDAAFGPVITFGAGGTMVEILDDQAMALPPLNPFLAQRLMDRARVARTLGAWRGAAPVKRQALEQVLLRVSEMACALPQLCEMDINPIIVDAHGAIAVDARIRVTDASASPHLGSGHGAYSHMAIQPYPSGYEQTWPLPGGGEYLVRPIRPDDAPMIQRLVRELSPESRYFRFASRLTELPAAMLARFTLIDYDRDMALVAVLRERQAPIAAPASADAPAASLAADSNDLGEANNAPEETWTERIIGVSRYVINPDPSSCEFALLVADEFASQGLGARLMHSIMAVAREQGMAEIQGLVLADNTKMLRLMRRLGFEVRGYPDEPEFKLVVHAL